MLLWLLALVGTGRKRKGKTIITICKKHGCSVVSTRQGLAASFLIRSVWYYAIFKDKTCKMLFFGLVPFDTIRREQVTWLSLPCSLIWTGLGFPGRASGKEPACPCRRHKRCRFDPRVGKIPWRKAWQPTSVILPRESHGQRSLMSYSP